jgi:hypothetical protein
MNAFFINPQLSKVNGPNNDYSTLNLLPTNFRSPNRIWETLFSLGNKKEKNS